MLQAGRFVKNFAKITACCWLLSGCEESPAPFSPPPPAEKAQHQLSRAIYSAHLQLDPHWVKVAADAAPVRDLLSGLMAYSPRGDVIPALAREWLSEDGKNWLFILDEQARWSNGDPVVAQDFVASWRRLADPKNLSPLAPYLSYMQIENSQAILAQEMAVETLGVKALNPHTLQIQLEQPNYQFPQMLAHSALLPTYRGQKPESKQPFISNGGYRVTSHSDKHLTLQAVDPYTPFQQVNYHLISTIQNPDRFDLLENPLNSYQRHRLHLPRLCTYFYEFNFADPLLAQKEVRRAISAMLSPLDISRGFGIPHHSALPRTMWADQMRQPMGIAPEKLLQTLGFGSQNPIRIQLTHDNQVPHTLIAQRIARTLGQSDLFRISLQEVSWDELLKKREQHAFQLIRSGWCADYPDPVLFLTQFHSTSPDNKSGYRNEEIDRQLEQIYQENLTPAEREAIILNIVQQLEQDVAILPLFQYQRRIALDPSVRGVDPQNSSEVIYSKDLFRQ